MKSKAEKRFRPATKKKAVKPRTPGVDRASILARYQDLIGSIEGPADLAEEHNHYIHGTPKRK